MYISEISSNAPVAFLTSLQKNVYATLETLNIPFQRVETHDLVTMEDCARVNEKFQAQMVKTLYLCNSQKTKYYLFITTGPKPFNSKAFSKALGSSRVSFADRYVMEHHLDVKIGAATIFSLLLEHNNTVQLVLDADVVDQQWYACSDGTTSNYLKFRTRSLLETLLPHMRHLPEIVTL
ncbi:prolyl-tRNA synthetase associated domain-containing protein [Pseudomonas sp. CCM 7891]|uniref:Prolyl-tRNA synthetase associated domain-containing protein n=1 Tax=Pseudomonas karstica TaxID=1055468 RepID=A0A7X2UYP3_9PSED|nr:YbaK/EbsC family protein [Pseudomonas karstica]MTD19305.1 prolyl-tRNA synthetase associated domain-containing protein [Pseudomonas karstica]